jgi:GntR family transcriptional regulator, carbon starvation induced regulator
MNNSEVGRTLAATAFSRIRADILGSRLLPGARLRFEPLKIAYGVGLSPLREALSRLVVSRLVTAEGQRGFRVAPASIDDIRDISYVRTNVECLAFGESVERGDDQWQADVVAAHYRLNLLSERNVIEPVDEELWEARHREFHLALLTACGSRWLLHIVSLLTDQFDRYRRLSVEGSLSGKPVSLEHQRIVDAALKRDADLAVRLLKEHIAHATRLIIENWPAESKPKQRGDLADATFSKAAKRGSKRAKLSGQRAS